jgi:hypothetical protein
MTLFCGKLNQRFTPVRYADIHFIYEFCDGNSRAEVEYRSRFTNRRVTNCQVFSDPVGDTIQEMGTSVPRSSTARCCGTASTGPGAA